MKHLHSLSSPIRRMAEAEVAPTRIGMLITSIAAKSGGVPEVVRSLTNALHKDAATRVEVFSMSAPGDADPKEWAGATLHYHAVHGPRSVSYAPALNRSLARRSIDVLHLHGLWEYPSVATRHWQARTGKPVLISPHGMLDPWALANSGWKKRIAGLIYENDNLRRAACLHALCDSELEAIRGCGLTNPVCVIPNGVDPAPPRVSPPPAWKTGLPSGARVLLYLGRLHPKKNLVELIHGWRMARTDGAAGAGWRLIIAGPGSEDYVALLRKTTGELGLTGSVRVIGPQYGVDKHAALASADAFILPSLSEGLPMAALEAWTWRLPTILTPACNLPEGYAAGAALPTDTRREGIASSLGQLFALTDERRRSIGQRGLELASTKFSWGRVAREFADVYSWLSSRGECPDYVQRTAPAADGGSGSRGPMQSGERSSWSAS